MNLHHHDQILWQEPRATSCLSLFPTGSHCWQPSDSRHTTLHNAGVSPSPRAKLVKTQSWQIFNTSENPRRRMLPYALKRSYASTGVFLSPCATPRSLSLSLSPRATTRCAYVSRSYDCILLTLSKCVCVSLSYGWTLLTSFWYASYCAVDQLLAHELAILSTFARHCASEAYTCICISTCICRYIYEYTRMYMLIHMYIYMYTYALARHCASEAYT